MKTTQKYGKKADLALSMWVKLVRATTTMGNLSRLNIESFGVTEPQFGVIETLGHKGTMALGELGKKRLVSSGNITCVVDNLEKEGLVERVHNSEDRRIIEVQLTKKGRNLFERMFVLHAEFIAGLASVLSEQEQQTLGALCKKLGIGLTQKE